MARSVLQTARILMRRRKFGYAITLLESNMRNYQGSSEFYLALGTSCLYIGDEGNAWKYYNMARSITITNSELLLGQAAIFLRHGETSKALQYYLDILNIDPGNETASKALEFIRVNGNNYDAICRLKDNGKIEQFYPPLGMNPDIIRNAVLVGLLCGSIISACIVFWPRQNVNWNGKRADFTKFKPNFEERSNPIGENSGGDIVIFLMDSKSILKSYENIDQYFQEGRENSAQVEINRVRYSNASDSLKEKAKMMQDFFQGIGFDNLNEHKEERYSYADVDSMEGLRKKLYENCYVAWDGRISNPVEYTDGSLQFELLVGYQDGKHVEGSVPVYCSSSVRKTMDISKPVRILGKLKVDDTGKISLTATSYWQSINGDLPPFPD